MTPNPQTFCNRIILTRPKSQAVVDSRGVVTCEVSKALHRFSYVNNAPPIPLDNYRKTGLIVNRRRPSHLRLHTEDAAVNTPNDAMQSSGERASVSNASTAASNSSSTNAAASNKQSKSVNRKRNVSSNIAPRSKSERTSMSNTDPVPSVDNPLQEARPLLHRIEHDAASVPSSAFPFQRGAEPVPHVHHYSNAFQLDDVAACLRSFAQATGWAIRSTATRNYSTDPHATGERQSNGRNAASQSKFAGSGNSAQPRWRLVDASPLDGILSADDLAHFPTVTLEHAEELLRSIEGLVNRLESAEQAVRRQEAELATGVSITRRPDEQEELADRLEAILSSAAKSIQATACAVYLLDETTSELKLRSRFGLPLARLSDPPRPLRGSLADLEALMGNAVLLEDTFSMPAWKSPEEFPSAIVVPIGSSSMPHGTIWFWSNQPRKYTTAEVEIANLTAGRIMGELEQTILGKEVQQAKRLKHQVNSAANAQAARLPDGQPLHRDFDFDGWTFQGDALGGGFHDWDATPSSMLVASVGSAGKTGPEGALIASSIQSAFRTLWPTKSIPAQIMQSAADMLFGIQPDEWTASAALLQLNPDSGYGMLSAAGSIQSFIISQRGFRPIGAIAPALASQVDASYKNHRFVLQPGEVLVAFSDTVVRNMPVFANSDNRSTNEKSQSARNRRAMAKSLDQNELLQSVRERIDDSASIIAGHLARMLPAFVDTLAATDRSLIVIKNKRKE